MTQCPRCDYDWTGLPTAHACPECGLAYDEYTNAFKPADSWAHIAIPAMLMAVVCLFYLTPPSGAARWTRAVVYGAAFAMCTGFLIRMVCRVRRGLKVVVMPDGTFVRSHLRDYWWRYEDIERLDMPTPSRMFSDIFNVQIVLTNGEVHRLRWCFATPTSAKRFQQTYDDARRRWEQRIQTAQDPIQISPATAEHVEANPP